MTKEKNFDEMISVVLKDNGFDYTDTNHPAFLIAKKVIKQWCEEWFTGWKSNPNGDFSAEHLRKDLYNFLGIK